MKADIAMIDGQGERRKVSPELLKEVVDGLDSVRAFSASDIWDRRVWSERVMFCLWEGQSPDGRKRREYLGKDPFPFDGASDSKVRLADFLVRVQVATLKQAVKRSSARFRGLTADGVDFAGHAQALGGWMLNNRMAGAWRMQIERYARWALGDSPAVSLMHVYHDRRDRLRMQPFGIEDLAEFLVSRMEFEEDELDAGGLAEFLVDGEREDELVDMLSTEFPHLKPKTLRKCVRRLREEGVTEFPVVELERNEPRVRALRMFEDVFVPQNTRDHEECRVVYVRHWLSRSEIEEKERMEGWSKKAVDELLGRGDGKGGHEGESYMGETDALEESPVREIDGQSRRKGTWEVFCAYIQGVNEDGVGGVFTVWFSGLVDEPLSEIELLDYPHGGMPFVWYVREYPTNNVLDSRGICELVQTEQDTVKRMRDLGTDHAQVFALPPFLHNMMNPEQQIRFSSFSLIRSGPTNFLRPIEIPQGSELPMQWSRESERQVSLYFGVPLQEINEMLQQLLTQDTIDDFMDSMRQVLLMLMQLAVTYMDDEEIYAITGGTPETMDLEQFRERIRKLRDIEIDFTAAVFDEEYIKTLSDIIQNTLLAIDTDNTIMRNELVDWLCRQISPSLANKILRPVEDASEQEVRDEEMNFAIIYSGGEPEMKEDGQNFGLRLQVLQRKLDLMDQNPELQEGWTPLKMQILQARMQHLQGQVQQQENAVIGRRMGQQVLEG